MSNNIQNILDEEFKLLIRATRNELFHFISIQYNHYDLVRKVKKDLVAQYPNRPVHSFNLDNCNPETFIHEILASKSGLVFIEKFDLIFTEPFRSLCIGFNQRRDLFSTFPIQIIVFIPSGEEYLQNFQKAMPDVFSIVNPMIQLVQEIEKLDTPIISIDNKEYNFLNIGEAKKEIERIEKRLTNLQKTSENIILIITLKANLAESYRFLGNHLRSKLLLEELLFEIKMNRVDNLVSEMEVVESRLALTLKDLGDYESAKKILYKLVISAQKNFGEDNPVTSLRYSNLGLVLRDLKEYKSAKFFLEKSLLSDMKNFGENHSMMATRYSNLAIVLKDLGEYEEAKKLLEKAKFLDEKNFGENHPTTAVSYSNLALVLQNLGDYFGAKKLLEKVKVLDELNFGVNHINSALGYSNLGTVYFHLGDFKNAVVLLEKAYEIYKNNLGDNHPSTKIIKGNLDLAKEQMK